MVEKKDAVFTDLFFQLIDVVVLVFEVCLKFDLVCDGGFELVFDGLEFLLLLQHSGVLKVHYRGKTSK